MMKRVSPPLTPLQGRTVPSRAGGSVPDALRAFQGRIIGRRYISYQQTIQGPQESPSGVPFALTRVPRADNRTEIYLLPTNFAFGTWVARLIAAPLNQRATTSEWTALNDFEKLEMKCYVILPFPHSSEALWGPQ